MATSRSKRKAGKSGAAGRKRSGPKRTLQPPSHIPWTPRRERHTPGDLTRWIDDGYDWIAEVYRRTPNNVSQKRPRTNEEFAHLTGKVCANARQYYDYTDQHFAPIRQAAEAMMGDGIGAQDWRHIDDAKRVVTWWIVLMEHEISYPEWIQRGPWPVQDELTEENRKLFGLEDKAVIDLPMVDKSHLIFRLWPGLIRNYLLEGLVIYDWDLLDSGTLSLLDCVNSHIALMAAAVKLPTEPFRECASGEYPMADRDWQERAREIYGLANQLWARWRAHDVGPIARGSPQWMGTREVVRKYGRTEKTYQLWIQHGRIPEDAWRDVGRRRVIYQIDDRWCRQNLQSVIDLSAAKAPTKPSGL